MKDSDYAVEVIEGRKEGVKDPHSLPFAEEHPLGA
jgi:D-serine dehydratase